MQMRPVTLRAGYLEICMLDRHRACPGRLDVAIYHSLQRVEFVDQEGAKQAFHCSVRLTADLGKGLA
jgi:hypothetical protein